VADDQARLDRILALQDMASVPQMVVRVMRMTASPGPGWGRATSSTRMSLGPWNTAARMVDGEAAGIAAVAADAIAILDLLQIS
jgi:hypothetical protein